MNIFECDILSTIKTSSYINQRILAEMTGYSLGTVNKSLQKLIEEGFLDELYELTPKAHQKFNSMVPRQAVILAAGYGMRMVPINTECPKGLITIDGEPLIERLINQLHEVAINDIYIVVGFMKERYEYLIDKYGVNLIVNPEYSSKNNLHSLFLSKEHIENAYILPCDIWCAQNPFRKTELYSWYMVTDELKSPGIVRVNRKMELVLVPKGAEGNVPIGISYLTQEVSAQVRDKLNKLDGRNEYKNSFWEDSLPMNGKWITGARVVPASSVVEINTYEQLRMLDEKSDQLKTDAIQTICKVLNIASKDIVNITVLKKGMTNRSFLFCCNGKKYIMRIPGEGTEELINRQQEAQVYYTIQNEHICDKIVYIDPNNGYKITEYLTNARACDADDVNDLARCMNKLRTFHEKKLQVSHVFDIFERIDFYESLWGNTSSIYEDYTHTKNNILSLRSYIETNKGEFVLTHIDAVPDNFLFADDDHDLRLIDWEYAGMQDPHVDIAMFCIYALYDRPKIDRLIDLYFTEGCTRENRIKIYCYIAICGLLWSNWCEYKRSLGIEFGEYSLCQYRYAKDYYRIVCEELRKERGV